MMSKPSCVGKAASMGKLAAVLCLVLLVGCVSTTTSRFANNANEAEALRKYTDLGLLYLQKGDTAEAMRPLKRALELGPTSPDVHAAFAMLFQLENDNLLAEKYFKNALKYSSGVNKTTTVVMILMPPVDSWWGRWKIVLAAVVVISTRPILANFTNLSAMMVVFLVATVSGLY